MGASGASRARRPVTTEWLTAPNIARNDVDGTVIVESAAMELVVATLPPFWELAIEVQYSHGRTGGTGAVYTWAKAGLSQLALALGDGMAPAMLYFGYTGVGGTAIARRTLVKPLAGYTDGGVTANTDRLLVSVRARGVAAATEWAVTGIKSRLIYVPL